MDWIDQSQRIYTWQAVVNAAMNLRFPKNSANLLAKRGTLLSSQELRFVD